MPLVALLAELGLVSEGVAAVLGAIAGCFAILHAWRLIRGAFAGRAG
jgi:hypothetical protein